MLRKFGVVFLAWMAFVTSCVAVAPQQAAIAGIVADPYTWSAGQAITAATQNTRFSTLYTLVNGNLDNANIASAAGIVLSKLDQTTEFFIKRSAGNQDLSAGTTGDTNPRVTLTSDGGIKFGAGGASALDSLIKRSGAAAFLFRNAADSSDATVGCGAITSSGAGTFSGVVTGSGFTKTGGSQGSALYVGASGVVTELAATANQFLGWNSAGTALVAKTAPICSGGRLSLESGVGLSSTDQLAKTTLYFTPYGQDGNVISIYDGTSFIPCTFSQLSTAVPSTTNTMYSVWATQSGGTVSISTNAWTNDTTPGTNGATTTLNGVLVANSDNTKRFLGVIRTTGSSGQCEDSKKKRFVGNALNRVPRLLYAADTTDSWSYASTMRAANGDTTAGVGRTEFILPIVDLVNATYSSTRVNNGAAAGSGGIGIALDSTSTPFAVTLNVAAASLTDGTSMDVHYAGYPAVGYHYLQSLEYVTSGTSVFYGDAGASGVQMSQQRGWYLNHAFRLVDTETRNKLKGKQNESNVLAFRPRALRTTC